MKITSFWLNSFLERASCGSLESAKKSCIVTLSLTDKSGFLIAPINYVYPDALRNVDIPVANVTVRKSFASNRIANVLTIARKILACNILISFLGEN